MRLLLLVTFWGCAVVFAGNGHYLGAAAFFVVPVMAILLAGGHDGG